VNSLNVSLAAASLSAAALAAPVPVPHSGPAVEVTPTSYQVIYNIDGVLTPGPELAYPVSPNRLVGITPSFDRWGGDESNNYNLAGANLAPCFLPSPSTRFSLGANARNVHYVDDYAGIAPNQIGRKIDSLAFAWLHNPPTAEPMRVYFQFWNDFNSDCSGFAPGSDSIVAARGFIFGVLLTFSGGAPVPGAVGYFLTNPDLSVLQLPPLPDADGAIEVSLIQALDISPDPGNQPLWSSRSQPMLWGTQRDHRNVAGQQVTGPFPLLPGAASQIAQWNDDGNVAPPVVDGIFTAPAECDSYSFPNICINPLGGMIAFFRRATNPPAAFDLTAPANGAQVSAPVRLEWQLATPAPASSTIRVSLTPDLSNPVFLASNIVGNSFDVPADALPSCQTYFWGVRAVNSTGDFTDSTTLSRSFTLVGADLSADFNNDGQVDFFDYLDFAAAFANEDPSADFNSDGQVDFFDYLDFAAAFARNC
jgi:hypothetical protein